MITPVQLLFQIQKLPEYLQSRLPFQCPHQFRDRYFRRHLGSVDAHDQAEHLIQLDYILSALSGLDAFSNFIPNFPF